MSTKPKDITCKKKDCFANHKGICNILTDTHFKKECPFYKPKEQKNIRVN